MQTLACFDWFRWQDSIQLAEQAVTDGFQALHQSNPILGAIFDTGQLVRWFRGHGYGANGGMPCIQRNRAHLQDLDFAVGSKDLLKGLSILTPHRSASAVAK